MNKEQLIKMLEPHKDALSTVKNRINIQRT
jgi:hypothetical protein